MFKSIPIRPIVGTLDTLSEPDAVGFGNWRLLKNICARSERGLQRAPGFRRFLADQSPYNNHDLHDQLVDRLSYFDSYSQTINLGGDFAGYQYPYFAPSYATPIVTTFTGLNGPYCEYIGNHPDGLYSGCPVFYAAVGFPYQYQIGLVNDTGLVSHWSMDDVDSATVTDEMGLVDLSVFGASSTPGIFASAANFNVAEDDFLTSPSTDMWTGDIIFGFCGWVNLNSIPASSTILCGRWGSAGSRSYRIVVTSTGALRFEVSNDGTASTGVTASSVLTVGSWAFFAAWHDSVANTINIKINGGAATSTSYSSGVLLAGSALYFAVGYDEASAGSVLDAKVDELSFFKNSFPSIQELNVLWNSGAGIPRPWDLTSICNTGDPWFYLYSYLYTSCPIVSGGDIVAGYPYGVGISSYSPSQTYVYDYCGALRRFGPGCREAITSLHEIVTETSRKIYAGTLSRIYELNQSTGNWRIIGDFFGSSIYSAAQCGCNHVRFSMDSIGEYLIATNDFDYPMSYLMGAETSGCDQGSIHPISDLVALGITTASGVVCWKGFTFFFNITENGSRRSDKIVWSDYQDPESFIESDTSFAGSAIPIVGASILAAAPLGEWLQLYTTRGVVRVSLIGGDDVFSFNTIYDAPEGSDCIAFRYSLVNTGEMHVYAGVNDLFAFTQYDTRPIRVAWITRACGLMFNGIEEDDAMYEPVNRDACNMVTGGYNSKTHEIYMSWATGENTCPNVTLRLNTTYRASDIIDHGFTAFLEHKPDLRLTVGKWIEDLGICSRGQAVGIDPKEGSTCQDLPEVDNPPTSIRNETEDPNLPVDPDSLCARLSGKTMEDFCVACESDTKFVMASAGDFCLKEASEDHYYREMLIGPDLAKSLDLDGVDDYATANGTALDITGTITIEMVFKFKTLFGASKFLIAKMNSTGDSVWGVYASGGATNNCVKFAISTGNAVISPEVFEIGRWYHIAATWDGTTLKLYKDGILIASEANVGPIDDNVGGELIFGATASSGILSDFSDITIGEVRVWNTARTSIQIYGSYNTSISSQSGLAGLWTMSTIADSSGNGNDLALGAEAALIGLEGLYDSYSCSGSYYERIGYDSVMQTGMELLKTDDEKIIKRVTLEAQAEPQAIPSMLECEVGYSAQPSCGRWATSDQKEFRCQTERTGSEHDSSHSRQDGRLQFPFWRRGIYLGQRWRIRGTGGAGKFTAAHLLISAWGQPETL